MDKIDDLIKENDQGSLYDPYERLQLQTHLMSECSHRHHTPAIEVMIKWFNVLFKHVSKTQFQTSTILNENKK